MGALSQFGAREAGIGLKGPQDVAVHILVTRHAGIGTNIGVPQIAHAGTDPIRPGVILARMR